MKTLTKTLHYDITQLNQEFLDILKDFSDQMHSEEIIKSLGKDFSRRISTLITDLSNGLQKNFSLVFVGDFKRGKSTLINALLGEEVVTTNITPETVTINLIQYGDSLRINACLTDGRRVQLQPDELKADYLIPILENLPQKVKHISIESPIQWLKGLCLVDTPGTGDIFKRFDRQVHDYLEKADGVIFLISALPPLSESEQAFLRLSVLPQDFPKLFFVINMMDLTKTDEEAVRLLHSIQAKINRLFPNTQLFALSALDEWSRIQSFPRPNLEQVVKLAESFQTFRDSLKQSILLERDVIQLSRATNQMLRLLQQTESKIMLLQNAMQADQMHLDQALWEYQNESSALFTKIRQQQQMIGDQLENLCVEASNWMSEFIQRFEAEALSTLSNYKQADIRRHYHFFFTDSFRQAISTCLNSHRSAMLDIADRAAKEISKDFDSLIDKNNLSSESSMALTAFGEPSWTILDSLLFLISYTPLKFVADLAFNYFKETEQYNKMISYEQKLKKDLPSIESSVKDQMQSLYHQIGQELEQQLETAYRQDIEDSMLAIKQAQDLSIKKENLIYTTNISLQRALSIIAETYIALKNFKEKLWSNLEV